MYLLDAIIRGLVFGIIMSISIGPSFFTLISFSLHHHYRTGLAFILGILFSDVVYVSIAIGASNYISMLMPYKTIISWIFISVLLIFGFISLRNAHKIDKSTASDTLKRSHYFTIFTSAFIFNMLNPGVVASWLVAALLMHNKTIIYKLALFTTTLSFNFGIDVLKIRLADHIKNKLDNSKIIIVKKISAFIILAIALVLMIYTLLH